MGERSRSNQRRGSSTGPVKITRDMERFSARQRKFCKAAITKIQADKNSVNFSRPVSELWDLSELPDYAEKVPNPMDLGTIDSKLDNKRAYIGPDFMFSVDQFSADVELTFHNAMDYNDKGTDMYKIAEKFLKWFADFMTDLPTEIKSSNGSKGLEKQSASDAEHTPGEGASDGGSGSEDRATALLARANELREKRDELQKKIDSATTLTLVERVRLRDEIERLPWSRCETVVDMLREDVDAALEKLDEKDPSFVDIDLDSVNSTKLREVWKFVWGPKGGDARLKLDEELTTVQAELKTLEGRLADVRRPPREGGRDSKRRRR